MAERIERRDVEAPRPARVRPYGFRQPSCLISATVEGAGSSEAPSALVESLVAP